MSAYKNIAIVGAGGSIGQVFVNKLIDAGFNLTIVRRTGSTSTYHSAAKVVDADYDSVDSLKAAFAGQDAVVSSVGTPGLQGQVTLVEGAIAAGVKRFLPSEYGCDLQHPFVRQIPVFAHKVVVEDLLEAKAKENLITYTYVYNHGFLDWGIKNQFLLGGHADGKAPIFDGGDIEFTATTLSSVGDAVVGVLNHPEETKNRAVRISDITISQNLLLKLAKEVVPQKNWQAVPASLDDAVAKSYAALGAGDFSDSTWVPFIYQGLLDKRSKRILEPLDNELLGVEGANEQYIKDYLKQLFA